MQFNWEVYAGKRKAFRGFGKNSSELKLQLIYRELQLNNSKYVSSLILKNTVIQKRHLKCLSQEVFNADTRLSILSNHISSSDLWLNKGNMLPPEFY